MRISRAFVGVVGSLAVGGAAQAAERLVLEPYPGPPWYDVINQTSGGTFVREQMPQGQTPEDPHDILTAQSVPGYRGQPSAFISTAFADLSKNCETVETVGPTSALEQGRPVAYGRLYCGRQKGQTYGAHIFFKAVLGSDALYVVDRDFRTPGSDKPGAPTFAAGQQDQAIAFLKAEGEATRYLTNQVYICDPVFPEARCSSEALPTGR
ncbi:MAG TPA: hypothetical protein VIJ94_15310 [Caulobacteraceae bacterium]